MPKWLKSSVSFSVDCAAASFGFGRNYHWVSALTDTSALTETGLRQHLSFLDEHLLPSLHSAQSFTPVSCYSGISGGHMTLTIVLAASCSICLGTRVASAQEDRLSPVTRLITLRA